MSLKILRVGDPHVTVRNIPEMEKLMDFIAETAKKEQVNGIEFMGDLFHTHAVIRVEVLDFWRRTFVKLSDIIFVNALVGNHDQPGSREKEQQMNALQTFKDIENVTIIDKPMIEDYGMGINLAYIPYMSDTDAFLEASRELSKQAPKCLIAHQTFTGATYENGFYAEDGIEPELVSQEHIISGHIHKQQIIGKCHYIGTPKWDTMSDANQDKGIWIFEHNEDGSVNESKFISTKDVVTPIVKIIVSEGDDEPTLEPNARNYLEFHGKTAWISKMKKKYKGKASIKAKPVDRKMTKLGVDKKLTLVDYLNDHFQPIDGVERSDINSYLKDVANV